MNTEYKIEKDIKIPGSVGPSGAPAIYPFKDMEVGDSFLASKGAITAAAGYASRHNVKFSSRKSDVPGQFRIWRIK